jgi:hypothetical protein
MAWSGSGSTAGESCLHCCIVTCCADPCYLAWLLQLQTLT